MSDSILDQVMQSTALPTNADTYFTQLAGTEGAVTSTLRYPQSPPQIEGMLREVNPVGLFVMMMNEGNFIDIAAWFERIGQSQSPGIQKWVTIASAVMAIIDDPAFHYYRCKILKPLGTTGDQIDTESIEACKQAMLRMPGIPQGVTPDLLSWDLISFKIPTVAIELLTHRFPDILSSLSPQELALLDQVEKDSFQNVIQKCQEFRQRTNTVEDELLPDVSIFLEQYVGGMKDQERASRIASVGRGMLIQYVSDMLPVFSSGNLPSTIAPSKIYSCHDVISSAELRGTIMKLAESQVIQQSTIIDRKLIMNRAYALSEGTDYAGKDWTKQQQTSMLIKKNVDTSMRRVARTFGINYDQPMAELENKLAGSSNTMGQQMEGHTTDAVLTMNEEQEEIARHTLSVLLACLRMRANAVQQSAWELLSDQDLDHLEIVRFLSQQQLEPSSGNNILMRVSTMMIEEYQDGHNVVKFGGKTIDQELSSMILYSIKGRAQTILRQIPMFDQDIRGGGTGLFDVYMWCLMQSMVQKQRILMETRERTQRKVAYDTAVQNIS